MDYIINYASSWSNYSVQNINNHHNFNFMIMTTLDDKQKSEFIQTMKLTIGMTYTDSFRLYIFKKLPDSQLLKYF
jgi:hypothetical protein